MNLRQNHTYASYMHLPELLALQHPISRPDNDDEFFFVIVHQVYELWFKQILNALEAAIVALANDRVSLVVKSLKRIHAVQRLLVEQVSVLETMTSREFNSFRGVLTFSAFDSLQFREIEFVGGMKQAEVLKRLALKDGALERTEQRLMAPTLSDAFYDLLHRRGFNVATHEARLDTLRTISQTANPYSDDVYLLIEDLIEFDELFRTWRYRHVCLVERMIGAGMGTGGSSGATYLATTLEKRFFPELWEARTFTAH